jgi:pyrroloquinoline quinone (PQQ) biosynthesis protein C
MNYIQRLNDVLDAKMGELAVSDNMLKVLQPGFVDKRLYGIYLIETFHYTRHNAKNQALVAVRPDNQDYAYMKYCLSHSMEEVGHEMMAYHDLKTMAKDTPAIADLPKPLSKTQELVDYLYSVASDQNIYARLGYSFWAEKSYDYIQPLLRLLAESLGLKKNSMTFLVQHAEIDKKHAEEVEQAITQFVVDENSYLAVQEVMLQSLLKTSQMLDAVFDEFVLLKENNSTKYGFLKPQ